jgi:shikimate dehydrogenase
MKRCGLLGEKLGHSYSPAIHAELADYEYRLYEVAPEKLGEFLTGGGFDGMNVTIPYKKAVIPYCAELSPIAQKLSHTNSHHVQ